MGKTAQSAPAGRVWPAARWRGREASGEKIPRRNAHAWAACARLSPRANEIKFQDFTPAGTPSLRGLVRKMAGLMVEESDKGVLRLRKIKPFPPGRSATDGDLGPEGTQHRTKQRSASVTHIPARKRHELRDAASPATIRARPRCRRHRGCRRACGPLVSTRLPLGLDHRM